jgi:hypothetical protein
MELTWVAILASLMMALGAACVFIFAVKRDYFRNIEDAKYQVFWSDLEEPDGNRPMTPIKEDRDAPRTRRSG